MRLHMKGIISDVSENNKWALPLGLAPRISLK